MQILTKYNFRNFNKFITNFRMMSGLSLKLVVEKLEEFAPTNFAENWDNVGLLIEPFTAKDIKTVFLTNDLTETVLDEAINKQADLIISYHPPIFGSLKRITQSTWKERLVAICLEKRIALYSPHTSWDSVKNGVTDWLASSIPHEDCAPILPNIDNKDYGSGRFATVRGNITLKEAIEKVKEHTGIKSVQLAIGKNTNLNTKITTFAVCAGAGSSVLKNIRADLFITGEMNHHECLDAIQRNISIILCNHSNSERGFLKQFRAVLEKMVDGKLKVVVTETDVDPLSAY